MQTFKNSQCETVLQNSSFKSRRGKSSKREELFACVNSLLDRTSTKYAFTYHKLAGMDTKTS